MGCAVLSAGGAQGYCAIITALAAAECQLVLGQVTRQLALAEPKASAARAAGLADAKEKATVAYTTYAGLVGKRAKRGMAHCHRLLGRLREDDKVPCREQSDAGVSAFTLRCFVWQDLVGACEEWKKALALYQQNNDSVLEAETVCGKVAGGA